jgi:hypothetical protein
MSRSRRRDVATVVQRSPVVAQPTPRFRSLRDAVQHDLLSGADFEAVAAVGRLQEEHVVACEAKYALDGSRHVLVQAVGKLDDDH